MAETDPITKEECPKYNEYMIGDKTLLEIDKICQDCKDENRPGTICYREEQNEEN